MAKESIVPGLGKKQAGVLMNEHARQLEHKRHLKELGFPEYVEPGYVRHAPVSYDDPSNPTPSKIVNQAGQDLGDPNTEESAHHTQNHYKIKKEMKKTRYPDVRIEVVSSGLMDKLLGRSQQKPSVVGEEKPTGKNLPDIESKKLGAKLLSRFTRGSKKPTYTSILKEWLAKEEEGGMAKKQLDRVSDLADMTKGADPRLKRAGVSGYNKPKRTPNHPTKSHIVVAKEGNKIKTIRYGQQGAKTAGDPKKGESEKMKKKRKSFKARHAKNIKRGKMSAAYWADKSKW